MVYCTLFVPFRQEDTKNQTAKSKNAAEISAAPAVSFLRQRRAAPAVSFPRQRCAVPAVSFLRQRCPRKKTPPPLLRFCSVFCFCPRSAFATAPSRPLPRRRFIITLPLCPFRSSLYPCSAAPAVPYLLPCRCPIIMLSLCLVRTLCPVSGSALSPSFPCRMKAAERSFKRRTVKDGAPTDGKAAPKGAEAFLRSNKTGGIGLSAKNLPQSKRKNS